MVVSWQNFPNSTLVSNRELRFGAQGTGFGAQFETLIQGLQDTSFGVADVIIKMRLPPVMYIRSNVCHTASFWWEGTVAASDESKAIPGNVAHFVNITYKQSKGACWASFQNGAWNAWLYPCVIVAGATNQQILYRTKIKGRRRWNIK